MSSEPRQYHVFEVLGVGGFGKVYRGQMHGTGGFSKPVAIKLLHKEIDDEDIAKRFRDEARILALVRHRAIVGADALVRLSGRWAVVMEYIDGVDLARVLGRHGAVPPGPALEVVSEIAAALDTAYDTLNPDGQPLRLLHRDIKPGNICVTGAGEVKVLDFGIAKAVFSDREAETRTLQLGSRGYLSPERNVGESDHGSDIYSVGVVLYEMLMGERFGRTGITEKEHAKKIVKMRRRFRERFADSHDALATLLWQTLHFDSAQRPTAKELKREVAVVRRQHPLPSLEDWVEDVVPMLIDARRSMTDELCGRDLFEGTEDVASSAADVEPSQTEDTEIDPVALNPSADSRSRPRQRAGGTRWMLAAGALFAVISVAAVAVAFAIGVWVAG